MTERTVITTRGLQLLARLASGAEQLEFTGVKVGTGVVPDGTDPAQLMHLVSYKMDGMIADYGYDQETDDAFVVMQITNAGITSGFVMTEVGLFAMDPDRGEILYAYVDLSEDPNYIMPEENGRAKTVQIKMHVVVGEAANITATINPLSQVTMEAFQRELGKKTDSEGGDISEAVAGFETPGAEIKYPELEHGGSVKGILGGMKRWLETLKKEKVTADGGEAGETMASFEDYTGDTPAPSVETALANIRSKGKTGNILSNIKAALMGLVTLGEMRKYLVNNGLCTEPGKFFLDAAYGKTLMDEITRLNGEAKIRFVPIPPNWNEVNAKNYGKGIILSPIWLNSSSPQKYIGAPLGAYTYGILVTFDMESYSPTFASLQIYFPDKANVNGIYVRAVTNQEWAKFVGTSINSVAASQ